MFLVPSWIWSDPLGFQNFENFPGNTLEMDMDWDHEGSPSQAMCLFSPEFQEQQLSRSRDKFFTLRFPGYASNRAFRFYLPF